MCPVIKSLGQSLVLSILTASLHVREFLKLDLLFFDVYVSNRNRLIKQYSFGFDKDKDGFLSGVKEFLRDDMLLLCTCVALQFLLDVFVSNGNSLKGKVKDCCSQEFYRTIFGWF